MIVVPKSKLYHYGIFYISFKTDSLVRNERCLHSVSQRAHRRIVKLTLHRRRRPSTLCDPQERQHRSIFILLLGFDHRFIGRLHERCLALLAGADIQFHRPNRLDVCLVQNHPIALCVLALNTHPHLTPPRRVFLPASDIPSFVGKGNVDLGITGHDVILEAQMEAHVSETLRLGFGKCALQVQVPDAAPVHSVDALAGKRIVTSFEVIAGRFFADVDKRMGLDARTQIEYVGGSVEAACALGLADGIGACVFSILM
jgi:ATP phosphoribosyltransferase